MSSADTPSNRLCVKCRKSDRTTFSTCRYCGAKYETHQARQAKQAESSGNMSVVLMGGALVLMAFVGAIAFGFTEYQRMTSVAATYKPDKLVGHSYHTMQASILLAPTESELIKFDTAMAEAKRNDPKVGSGGLAGINAASNALDSLNQDKDNSISLVSKAIFSRQLTGAHTNDGSPVKVAVLGAGSSDQFDVVRVRVLNGSNLGAIGWINVDELDL